MRRKWEYQHLAAGSSGGGLPRTRPRPETTSGIPPEPGLAAQERGKVTSGKVTSGVGKAPSG